MQSGSVESASRSRAPGWRVTTEPTPVITSPSGRCDALVAVRDLQSACLPRKPATSIAWANRARAPIALDFGESIADVDDASLDMA